MNIDDTATGDCRYRRGDVGRLEGLVLGVTASDAMQAQNGSVGFLPDWPHIALHVGSPRPSPRAVSMLANLRLGIATLRCAQSLLQISSPRVIRRSRRTCAPGAWVRRE